MHISQMQNIVISYLMPLRMLLDCPCSPFGVLLPLRNELGSRHRCPVERGDGRLRETAEGACSGDGFRSELLATANACHTFTLVELS